MACLTLPLIIVLKPVVIFRSLFSLIKNCWGQARKSQKHTNERVLNLNSFDTQRIPSPAGPQLMNGSDSDKTKTINALSLNNFDPQMRERIGPSSLSTARVESYSYFGRPQFTRPYHVCIDAKNVRCVVCDCSRDKRQPRQAAVFPL